MLQNCLKLMACLVVVFSAMACQAMVEMSDSGDWPKDWPQELEPLRSQARTIGWATGAQQTVYEIRFESREQFEAVWPLIVGLKSPGGVLTLSACVPLVEKAALGPHRMDAPIVRIYTASGAWAISPRVREKFGEDYKIDDAAAIGLAIHAAAPWPDSLLDHSGHLPEWVTSQEVDGKLTWRPITLGEQPKVLGFMHRARIDIELVVDGQVIDLNRTQLPADTTIIDQRFAQPTSESEATK